MNYSTAIFLINDRTRALACTYEAGESASRTIFKTLDQTLKIDDYVVVPTDTRHKMTIVKVVAEVDSLDVVDSSQQFAWIVGKVERADYEALLAAEQDAIKTIQKAEKRRKMDDLRKTVMADQEAELANLSIAKIGAPGLPEQPAAPKASE